MFLIWESFSKDLEDEDDSIQVTERSAGRPL